MTEQALAGAAVASFLHMSFRQDWDNSRLATSLLSLHPNTTPEEGGAGERTVLSILTDLKEAAEVVLRLAERGPPDLPSQVASRLRSICACGVELERQLEFAPHESPYTEIRAGAPSFLTTAGYALSIAEGSEVLLPEGLGDLVLRCRGLLSAASGYARAAAEDFGRFRRLGEGIATKCARSASRLEDSLLGDQPAHEKLGNLKAAVSELHSLADEFRSVMRRFKASPAAPDGFAADPNVEDLTRSFISAVEVGTWIDRSLSFVQAFDGIPEDSSMESAAPARLSTRTLLQPDEYRPEPIPSQSSGGPEPTQAPESPAPGQPSTPAAKQPKLTYWVEVGRRAGRALLAEAEMGSEVDFFVFTCSTPVPGIIWFGARDEAMTQQFEEMEWSWSGPYKLVVATNGGRTPFHPLRKKRKLLRLTDPNDLIGKRDFLKRELSQVAPELTLDLPAVPTPKQSRTPLPSRRARKAR